METYLKKDYMASKSVSSCFCVGPQNGEPLCPCAMRSQNVMNVGGRWIKPAQDLGPVNPSYSDMMKAFYEKYKHLLEKDD